MMGIMETFVPVLLPSFKDSSFIPGMSTVYSILNFLALIVGIFFVYRISRLLKYIADMLFKSTADLKIYGQWAVITGCTDGIGKAYAKELAKQGMHLVLISRTREKLEALAKDLKADFHTNTKIIAVDFTSRDPQIYKEIQQHLYNLDIGVLINNVGMSYEYPEYYSQLPDGDKFLTDMIYCNIISMTQITRIILPWMEAKKKGLIMNISSVSSVLNCPLLCAYSGSKAFIDKWSQGLALEVKRKGIIVQTVVPGYVSTKLSGMKKSSINVPSPGQYVRSQLRTIGRQERTSGFWFHEILMQFGEVGQIFTAPLVNYLTTTFMHRQRRKALQRRGLYKLK